MQMGKQLQGLSTKSKAFICVCLLTISYLSNAVELPANIQAVLLTKVLAYEDNIDHSQISVFVVDNSEMYQAFSRLKNTGTSTKGKVKIQRVSQGDSLPTATYSIVYINDEKYLSDALKYAEKHKAIIATGKTELVKRGATIGTGTVKGKAKFYLNLTSSFTAQLKWKPKVLKIVTTFP
ncbi:hypothetical protein C2869_10190 [Saccharobesus litoralis]|uniref:Uncharacterized protein n=1 Tax=Saccharobesus litoralis TaxID=2172099 RepID=A0A2S0VRF9_9ALTE|nr:YfiR/HmsC family protein [Saccharobesus litoralis]AWB66772.1 hypothetical protein C2869_10190 [Saccharobesus litoralis]